MRVLVVHNKYSSRVPSGENLAVGDEVRWLRDAGVEVHTYEADNDEALSAGAATQARQAVWTTWSLPAQHRMTQALRRTRADLVHVHNLFPLLSSSVVWAALRGGLPVVWTVHNHRVVCVGGNHFRDGAPCHRCRPGWRVPGIRFGCYNDSHAASAAVTAATSVFRSMARRRVTCLAISDHLRQWLIDSAGFSPDRVEVKYNGVCPVDGGVKLPPAASRRTFLFMGRMAEHKGVRLLLDAWGRLPDVDAELRFVGQGPLAEAVVDASAGDARISWLGQVDARDIGAQLAAARTVVVPSTWEEPFGRSAAEALASGRPVITTGRGGLSEVVDERSGWVTGLEPEALALAIANAASSDEAVERRSRRAAERHRELFSPQATTRSLLDVYDRVLADANVADR